MSPCGIDYQGNSAKLQLCHLLIEASVLESACGSFDAADEIAWQGH